MYQNVYLHKTTRGFEKMLEAMWRRAKTLRENGKETNLLPVLHDFWSAGDGVTVRQYGQIEEFTVLQQIQQWTNHDDKPLADLARRFLERNRYAAIEAPAPDMPLAGSYARWESELHNKLKDNGYPCFETHCLCDALNAKYTQPYFPEKENAQQSSRNAIRVRAADGPVEISTILERLRPVTKRGTAAPRRYYIPCDVRAKAQALKDQWSPEV